MTQDSFYWSGTTSDSPGDAGPYVENTMWRNLAQTAIAGGAESDSDLYNIGVFYSVANKLEVTLDGTNLDVNTGAALVDGAYYENDASVDITVDAAAAGDERIDYIVLRKCYEGSTYNPGGDVPAVDEQEVRITVIKGTEVTPPAVPSTPSLTQDTGRTTYWDIPLATVEVDDTGATSVTDAREYVDVTEKSIWVPVVAGQDRSGIPPYSVINPSYDVAPLLRYVTLQDAQDSYGYGRFYVPNDFVSNMEATGIIMGVSGGGDIFGGIAASIGACSESYANHSQIAINSAEAIQTSENNYSCHFETTISDVNIDDFVLLTFSRSGGNVSDTINNDVNFIGFFIKYLGWK
jgi:hypothetical protein